MKASIISISAAAAFALGMSGPAVFGASSAQPLANTPAVTATHDQAHEAHRVIAEAADRALGTNGVHGLLNMIDKTDRDRIQSNLVKGDKTKYESLVKDIRAKWKSKFGTDFNAQALSSKLVDLKTTITGTGANQRASIQLPGEPGENAYELRLTREKNGWWRINVPDTVDGKTFHNDMMSSIEKVDKDMDQLPSDKGQATQRVVTETLHALAFPAGT